MANFAIKYYDWSSLYSKKRNSLAFLQIFLIYFENISSDFGVIPETLSPGTPSIDIFGNTFGVKATFFGKYQCPPQIEAGIISINCVSDSVIVDPSFLTDIIKLLALSNFKSNRSIFSKFDHFSFIWCDLPDFDISIVNRSIKVDQNPAVFWTATKYQKRNIFFVKKRVLGCFTKIFRLNNNIFLILLCQIISSWLNT